MCMYMYHLQYGTDKANLFIHFIFTLSTAGPMTAPNITGITPLSSTSFTVSWTITDPDHNYIVTWTNLHTGVMDTDSSSEYK